MDKKRFNNWTHPEIEEGVPSKYNWVVQNINNFKLGFETDIGAFTYINAKYGVIIGERVQIGSHCSIYSISSIDNKSGLVEIKSNACIGSHSTIFPNVTIGENSIIGAHSFVNKSIPSNVLAYGVPIKVVKNLEK
tara:strand:+ start:28391 stop:28795 length:405 start_codon:yes stop_codon:yes gene_type:complete